MKISVLTTSYNYAGFISETIESVLKQTFSDFEYIIFDDGSQDNSLEIIGEYAKKDERIKVFTHENHINKGLVETMKIAITKCSGEYIVFVESDDILAPNYLEEKLIVLRKYPDAAVIFNKIFPFGDEQQVNCMKKYLKNTIPLIKLKEFKYVELLHNNIIPTFSCTMVKKEILENINFDFKVAKCFDWYLWNYIMYSGEQMVYLDKELTNFRMHKQSMSCKPTNTSVYVQLLKISKRKYKCEIFYKIFELHKNNKRLEKLFRPIIRKINTFIYNLLFEDKTINIITET